MRLSHIESRLEQQVAAIEVIMNAYDNVKGVGLSNITTQRVHTRISALKEDWEKFSLTNDAINVAISALSYEDRLTIKDHSYFTEKVFSKTHEEYLEALKKMTSLLDTNSTEMARFSSSPFRKILQILLPFITIHGFRGLIFRNLTARPPTGYHLKTCLIL